MSAKPVFRNLSVPILLAVFLAACGGGDGGKSGKLDRVARMNFRPVADSDPMLAKRFEPSSGVYSIRPPAGWDKSPVSGNLRMGEAKHAAFFRDKASGESMAIYISAKNSGIPGVAMLMEIRDRITAEAGKDRGKKLVGTDIFSFRGRLFVQSLIKQGEWVELHLYIFFQSGKMIDLNYRVRVDNYRLEARAIEASVASMESGE